MFKSILLPVDLDKPTTWFKTLPAALVLANNERGFITLGTVISDWEAARDAQWSPFGYPKMVEDAERKLKRIAKGCEPARCDVKVTGGPVGSGILELAELVEADLIILASHHPGLKDYLIGANALHVVRHADCSVFVVRE